MKATQEQAAYFLPFVKALAEGKKLQVRDKGTVDWQDVYTGEGSADWLTRNDFENFDFRVAPEPRLRPWRAEEVPVGAQIRWKDQTINRFLLLSVSDGAVFIGYRGKHYGYSFSSLLEKGQYSKDGQEPWLPCGVSEDSQ